MNATQSGSPSEFWFDFASGHAYSTALEIRRLEVAMARTWGGRLTRAAIAVRSIGLSCLLSACLAAAGVAHAAGAIAVGLPDDVAKDGISMSIYVNASSVAKARSEALANCKSTGSTTARALCKIVATFNDRCAAEALDPKDGTPGFGWAIADTGEEAKRQAIANCRTTAGPDRQAACAVPDKAWCDGRAR